MNNTGRIIFQTPIAFNRTFLLSLPRLWPTGGRKETRETVSGIEEVVEEEGDEVPVVYCLILLVLLC